MEKYENIGKLLDAIDGILGFLFSTWWIWLLIFFGPAFIILLFSLGKQFSKILDRFTPPPPKSPSHYFLRLLAIMIVVILLGVMGTFFSSK